ncbi:ribosomal protein L37AE/L43A [Bradyrhizobium japonicum]
MSTTINLGRPGSGSFPLALLGRFFRARILKTPAADGVSSAVEISGMALSTNERPMCPVCKHRMGLARISPGPRGFDERTFECSTCERTEVVRLAVDPMQTDAVGWLAGELKPPN